MKQLIEDYQRKIDTLTKQLASFKSNGSENDLKKETRLTTKASEYRTFIVELERLNVQNDNVQVDTIEPDQTPKLVSLIDFSMLKEQKASLNYVIDYLETEQIMGTCSNNLIGLLN